MINPITRIRVGARRALRVAGRPVRHGADTRCVIQPYRGYGSEKEIYLHGRVFRQPTIGSRLPEGSLPKDILDVLRRFIRWGLGNRRLVAHFNGQSQEVATDRDGYFDINMRLESPPPLDKRWHNVHLDLHGGDGCESQSDAAVFIPSDRASIAIISDIDDTVMYTGVVDKIMMFWRLFVQGASSRIAFPGVGALYQALHRGASGEEDNPMLYVSRGPWSIYEMLEEFFNMHSIPTGPVLFLREWGLTVQRPLPKRAESHKRDLIEQMLRLYSDLPFILIGDSGQHDPEVYAEVVRDHPGRIRAIYIRNVTKSGTRRAEIEALAREVAAAGTSLVLAADSFAIAEHAADQGFISPLDLKEVMRERAEFEEAPTRHATREVSPLDEHGRPEEAPIEKVADEATDDTKEVNIVVDSNRE